MRFKSSAIVLQAYVGINRTTGGIMATICDAYLDCDECKENNDGLCRKVKELKFVQAGA